MSYNFVSGSLSTSKFKLNSVIAFEFGLKIKIDSGSFKVKDGLLLWAVLGAFVH